AFGSALAAAKEADREGPPTQPTGLDFDMDLDLPGGLSPAAAPVAATPASQQPSEQDFASLAQWEAPAATPASPAHAADNGLSLDLDDLASFSLPATASQAPAPAASPVAEPIEQGSLNALEFDLDSFTLPLQSAAESTEEKDTSPAELTVHHAAAVEEGHSTEAMTLQLPIDADSSPTISAQQAEVAFDLGGLSLDLGAPNHEVNLAAVASPAEPEDPLATKLALAEEFNAIGDSDGARTLIEEVIAEAHGDLKAKALSLLSQIG
ncbi:MAG: FimV/HubP family polar landmark protein, partial [Comamonas sp.]